MKRLLSHKSKPIPSTRRLFFWSFFVTVIGLTSLLVLPIIGRHQHDRYQAEIDEQVVPARNQILNAIEQAYQARDYATTYYFLLEATPHAPFPSCREYYEARVKDWQQATSRESSIRCCGEAALLHWHAGTKALGTWIGKYGRQSIETGASPGQDEMQKAEALFVDGIRSLHDARQETELVLSRLWEAARVSSQVEVQLTAPLTVICILLASLSWWNARRLIFWSEKERATSECLQVTVRELDHRVGNNLQTVLALIDVAMSPHEEAIPAQSVHRIAHQLHTMAFVHNLFHYEQGITTVGGDLLLQKLIAKGLTPPDLHVQVEAASTLLTSNQTAVIALIVGELLWNFQERGSTAAHISLTNDGKTWRFCLASQGDGGWNNSEPIENAGRSRMVNTLVRHDLQGELVYRKTDVAGKTSEALVEITFPVLQPGASPGNA